VAGGGQAWYNVKYRTLQRVVLWPSKIYIVINFESPSPVRMAVTLAKVLETAQGTVKATLKELTEGKIMTNGRLCHRPNYVWTC